MQSPYFRNPISSFLPVLATTLLLGWSGLVGAETAEDQVTEETPAATPTPQPAQRVESVPEGYLRLLILIQGRQDPAREFGMVGELPYPLEILLRDGREAEIPLLGRAYAFQISGYRPIPAGRYELVVRSNDREYLRERLEIAADDFLTLLVTDRNRQPMATLIRDVDYVETPEGLQKSKAPRIRLGNFIPGVKAAAASPALNLKLQLPEGTFQTIHPPQAGVYELGVGGTFNGKPFTRVSEINLNLSPQLTVFLGEDLYQRPVVYLLPDAVLD